MPWLPAGGPRPRSAPQRSPWLSPALRPGEAAPGARGRARHPHPEDVSGLAVPDPVPADAQEPDHHLRLVPVPHGEKGGPSCASPAHPSPLGQSPPALPSPPYSSHLSPPQQKNRYKQMKRSALIIQAYARGWKVRAGHRGAGSSPGVGSRVGGHMAGRGGGLRVPHGGTRLISSPRLPSFSPASLLPLSLSLPFCVGVSPPRAPPGALTPRSLAGSSGS